MPAPAFHSPWPGPGASKCPMLLPVHHPAPVCEPSPRMRSVRPGSSLYTQIPVPRATPGPTQIRRLCLLNDRVRPGFQNLSRSRRVWAIHSEVTPSCPFSLPSDLQKEEVGEALHDVDFQQLKIENAQFLETIEGRNQELIRLKLASGTTLQVLNSYKVRSTPCHRAVPTGRRWPSVSLPPEFSCESHVS